MEQITINGVEYLGITVTNQKDLEYSLQGLLSANVEKRCVIISPMLGYIDLTGIKFDRFTRMNVLDGCGINKRSLCQSIPNAYCEQIDIVIAEGNAEPLHPIWVRALRDQCRLSNVPFVFKGWGEWSPYGNANKHDYIDVPFDPTIPDHHRMFRVGKKAAGRLLDGVLHDEYPDHFRGDTEMVGKDEK